MTKPAVSAQSRAYFTVCFASRCGSNPCAAVAIVQMRRTNGVPGLTDRSNLRLPAVSFAFRKSTEPAAAPQTPACSRQAKVHDFVVRVISGHATVAMQERYRSVAGDEVRAGLAKVISLAGSPSVRSAALVALRHVGRFGRERSLEHRRPTRPTYAPMIGLIVALSTY